MSIKSINSKILLIVGALCFSLAILGAIGLIGMNSMDKSIHELVENSLPLIRNISLVDMGHDGLNSAISRAVLGFKTNDKKMIVDGNESVLEIEKSFKEQFVIIDKSLLDSEMKKETEKQKILLDSYVIAGKNVMQSIESNNLEEVKAQFDNFGIKFKELEKSLDGYGELIQNDIKKTVESKLVSSSRAIFTFSLILGLSLFFALLFSFLSSVSISRSLNLVVTSLQDGVQKVRNKINELSTTSIDLSSSANSQASALQQTSTAMEEISSMLLRTSENSVSSVSASKNSQDKAQKGFQAVEKMILSIDEIRESNKEIGHQVAQSNQQISLIVNVIREIEGKTKVINDIVFQTKLLSFNASVEAARAGESGKGFAVVAEEVGNLAQMSGGASKEISQLLEESVKKVESIVETTRRSVSHLISDSEIKVNQGLHVAQECKIILNEIVDGALEVLNLSSSISSACNEQSVGVKEVTEAIHQLDSLTTSTSSSADSCREISKSLSVEAEVVNSSSIKLAELANLKVS